MSSWLRSPWVRLAKLPYAKRARTSEHILSKVEHFIEAPGIRDERRAPGRRGPEYVSRPPSAIRSGRSTTIGASERMDWAGISSGNQSNARPNDARSILPRRVGLEVVLE